ncbi:MAG: TlpA family protein disulfide reductase [Acidimicrobiia bacterium]|nr:TlpA family protein disulfide reductase [Acidimicrobiia bacterium]
MAVVVVVLVGAVVAAVLLTSGGKNKAKTAAGEAAPDFTLPSLQDGKGPISLASYKGTPVLVNFWATWCTPCEQEMPLLEAAHARWGSKVQFIGIDRQDYKPDALAFAQRTHVTYPLAADPNATLDGAYRLRGMPTSVFIDRNGNVVLRVTGPVTKSQLDDTLKSLTATGATS